MWKCAGVKMWKCFLPAGMFNNKEIHILTSLIPAAYLNFVPVRKPEGRFHIL